MRHVHVFIGIKRSIKATLGLYRENIALIENALRPVFEKDKNTQCIFHIEQIEEETMAFDIRIKINPGLSAADTISQYSTLLAMRVEVLENLVRTSVFTQPVKLLVLIEGIESFCGVVTIGEKLRTK